MAGRAGRGAAFRGALCLLVLGCTAVHMIFYVIDRCRLPIMPVICAGAALGLRDVLSRVPLRPRLAAPARQESARRRREPLPGGPGAPDNRPSRKTGPAAAGGVRGGAPAAARRHGGTAVAEAVVGHGAPRLFRAAPRVTPS